MEDNKKDKQNQFANIETRRVKSNNVIITSEIVVLSGLTFSTNKRNANLLLS